MRNAKKEDFIGKTISNVNLESTNVHVIYFTDGTFLEFWGEIESPFNLPLLQVRSDTECKEEEPEFWAELNAKQNA